MILPQELHEPLREGQIREIRNDRDGVVYLVQWSDTGHESLLPHGPDVVIKHRHTPGGEAVTAGNAPWRDGLRHPLEWRHNRDLERRQQVGYERLAQRVEEIIAGLELTQSDFSIAGGRIFHIPQVISVDTGHR